MEEPYSRCGELVQMNFHPAISGVSSSSTVVREAEQETSGDDSDSSKEFRIGLLALSAFLRSYAFSLCRDRDLAEDLAQDASCRAWASRARFQRGSNLKAWVFTILRNLFYSHRRHAWRQQAWNDDIVLNIRAADNEQSWAVQLSDVAGAMHCLPSEQRDALILVAVGGFAYADAAAICNCPVGTAKSRVARARKTILTILEEPRPRSADYRTPIGLATPYILARLDQLRQQSGPILGLRD